MCDDSDDPGQGYWVLFCALQNLTWMLNSISGLSSLSVTDISAVQGFFFRSVDFPMDKLRFAFSFQNWNLRYVSKNHWLCSLWQHLYYNCPNIYEHLWYSKTLSKIAVKAEQNVSTILTKSVATDSDFGAGWRPDGSTENIDSLSLKMSFLDNLAETWQVHFCY